MKALRGGISDAVREDRRTIFGENTIEIDARSILQLLVDEVGTASPEVRRNPHLTPCQKQVLHPFYVFQIASIILWSLDDYYYYAVTIFLISILSITTTLIETRNVSGLRLITLPQLCETNAQYLLASECRTYAHHVSLHMRCPGLAQRLVYVSRCASTRDRRLELTLLFRRANC